MDSQTLGLILMMIGLPLIISIPVTAFIWGGHLRKLEAIRLENSRSTTIESLEARIVALEQKLSREKTQKN